jgi:SAM-dependent methyltransferase
MNNYEFCAKFVSERASEQGARVLDYGCGAGQLVSAMLDMGLDAKGCDAYYEGGSYLASVPAALVGTRIMPMTGAEIPYASDSFDFVVNNQVLEHVEDLDLVLTEIHRVLRPGGVVLSLFPDRRVWREGHCGIPFLHWFKKGSSPRIYYAVALRAVGFGHFKEGKSVMEWSRDFCVWLDKWTHYRSYGDIRRAFEARFVDLTHIESLWLRQRLGSTGRFVEWLPSWAVEYFVRKAAGLVFVSRKSELR